MNCMNGSFIFFKRKYYKNFEISKIDFSNNKLESGNFLFILNFGLVWLSNNNV